MKKIYLIIIIAFIGIDSYSQNVAIGIKIGASQSKLTGEYGLTNDYIDYIPVYKMNFGCFLNYNIVKDFSFQPEINFKTKGFEYHTSDGVYGGYLQGNADFNYLDIPILIKYSYGNKFKIFVNMGPSINILISGGEYYYSVWGSHDPNIGTIHYSRNIKSDFHDITLGINGGFGIQSEISANVELFSEFRVLYDVTETTYNKEIIDENTNEVWYYNNPRFLNLSLDFGMLYRF